MPLTQLQVKNAKIINKPLKVSDGGGLFLLVKSSNPKDSKYWRATLYGCNLPNKSISYLTEVLFSKYSETIEYSWLVVGSTGKVLIRFTRSKVTGGKMGSYSCQRKSISLFSFGDMLHGWHRWKTVGKSSEGGCVCF